MGGVAHTAVVLCFPDFAEVRFLEHPPRRGQRVESRFGGVWFVADVLRSGTRTYTVTCVSKRDFVRDLFDRRSSDIVSDVLALARKAIPAREGVAGSSPDEASRGWKRRAETGWIETYLEASWHGHAPDASGKVSHDPKPRFDWINDYLAATFAQASPKPTGRRRSRLRGGRRGARQHDR